MTVMTDDRLLSEPLLEMMRQTGNPFRNFFARNPDDELCTRYHVPELFATERAQLFGVVDLYRVNPTTHSELIPILGNKGAGKTHLLHSIKHGSDGRWQMLVTPGTFQKDTDFLEYLLFQVIDTLLGGGKLKGQRPLEYLSEELTRRWLARALGSISQEDMMELFPAPGMMRWMRRLGLGSGPLQERIQWLTEQLARSGGQGSNGCARLRRLCAESELEVEKACELVWKYLDRTETHNTAGLMRRHIGYGFVRAALLGDESELANFLTYGFAEIDYRVTPSRQDLVLALFRVLMEVFQSLKVPVVVAFDQLEDLLLARRTDDGHRMAEAFFAGIVQAMHHLDGICFLVFAKRGLWNRFVPSLDGYIQDRLNNPVHVAGHGTIKALRLEAPPLELVRRVVEVRLAPTLEGQSESVTAPFTEEQIQQIARTEPTLRDMLQQFRQLFDHLVYGKVQTAYDTDPIPPRSQPAPARVVVPPPQEEAVKTTTTVPKAADLPVPVKSVVVVEVPVAAPITITPPANVVTPSKSSGEPCDVWSLWQQEMATAKEKLAPEGSLTGATRELQAGLGAFLQTCHEHGVKVGPWRLQHVVAEFTFSEHPTYGAMSIAHWVCKDGQPWKVGIGLFLGRGAGKPRDLEIKLTALDMTPHVIDHLILLRPDDDMTLSGKSKSIWQESERQGCRARLEALCLDHFTTLYGFPRWLATMREALPPGQALPNVADLIQEHCEQLLQRVCLPV